MITEKDLQEAIAECEGQRNPGAYTCMKLAAFYTIKDKMYPNKEQIIPSYQGAYYDSGENRAEKIIEYNGQSEFSRLINGRKVSEVLPIIADLMDAFTAINPRLYNNVIHKLE